MAWNEPGKDKDPWSGKNQPPDLDEALKRLQAKIKKMLKGKSPKINKNGKNGRDVKFDKINLPFNSAGSLALVLFILVFTLWILSGIFIVDPAEQAVILRFGKYQKTVGPGPHWIPRFIESKIVGNVERISAYTYSAQMLTKDENLVSVEVVVRYRIGDLEEYLFNVADPEGSIKQATSSALRQVVGTTTLDQLITEGREVWASNVQDLLIKILHGYKIGVIIVNVSPQQARAPESVQDAFDDAIKAQEDEKRFKEQAEAYAARVVPIAEGNAKRILAEANAFASKVVLQASGEVAEYLSLLPEYMRNPVITGQRMYLEVMQKILSKNPKIIVETKSNVLYLPLDKLGAFGKTSGDDKSSEKNKEAMKSQNENNSPLFDGRDLMRPTERFGRSD